MDARTRDLTIDSPSVGVVKVRLLLPEGFEGDPSARRPVLYLLHGAWGNHADWTNLTDVEALTAPTDLLVVMPDAATGWYADAWNGGPTADRRRTSEGNPINRRVLGISAAMAIVSSALLASTATAELFHYPADVYRGTCAEVGDIAGALAGVSDAFTVDDTYTGTDAPVGSDTAIPVSTGFTTALPLAYGDLLETPHAIVVHHGSLDAVPQVDILCGDIGGSETTATPALVMGLGELNDSGFTGIAMIRDNGDSTVRVEVYITNGQPESGVREGEEASPEPSPSPAP